MASGQGPTELLGVKFQTSQQDIGGGNEYSREYPWGISELEYAYPFWADLEKSVHMGCMGVLQAIGCVNLTWMIKDIWNEQLYRKPCAANARCEALAYILPRNHTILLPLGFKPSN